MKIRHLTISVVALCLCADAWAKKDYKGLFGSYRREKFTENEARDSDFGMDIMLSTMLPLQPFVRSTDDRSNNGSPMQYSTFFNAEIGAHLSLGYYWQLFATIGYYNYDTRIQKPSSSATQPQFNQFEIEAFPIVAGLRYRFSTSDIVPYLSLGAGISITHRRGYFDYNPTAFPDNSSSLVLQGGAGVEFYIAPRTGIRLEMTAMQMGLSAKTLDTGASTATLSVLYFQGSPWSIRYASGLFMLF